MSTTREIVIEFTRDTINDHEVVEKMAYEIHKLREQNKKLNKQISDAGWRLNPDRMGR